MSYALITQESGATMLTAGGTLVATGGVTIHSGSLGGVGTVQANVSLAGASPETGAHLVPGGASVSGQLNVTGTCALGANTTTEVDLGGVAPGESDLVSISGAATLASTLLATYAPDEGDTIKVMRFASRTGTFASVTGILPYPGILLTPVYQPPTGSDPASQQEEAAEPLPAALALRALAGAAECLPGVAPSGRMRSAPGRASRAVSTSPARRF